MLVSRQGICRIPRCTLTTAFHSHTIAYTQSPQRHYTDSKNISSESSGKELNANPKSTEHVKPKKKTQAELDQELQLKLQGLAGDGGEAGIEYEDGKPVAMKRSVRNNMFRYI